MLILQATIGRNARVSLVPMDDVTWMEFRRETAGVLSAHAEGQDMFTETHLGWGEWTDVFSGVAVCEESAKIALAGVGNYDSAGIMRDLAKVAEKYDQDAIALSVSVSILVQAESHALASV